MTKAELQKELKALLAAQKSDLVTWKQQWFNLQARWEIHQQEWDLAVTDVKQLGRQARDMYESFRTA